MELWEVTNSVANVVTASQSSYKGNSSTEIVSAYSKILAEKISNARVDMEAMEAVQESLDEIRDLHEELTGEVKLDEDSGNANRDGGSVSTPKTVETVKRFMPDGSIMVTTYEDGKITEQVKHKPQMMVVPDYTAPPNPDGTVATELKPYQNFDLEMLLMM